MNQSIRSCLAIAVLLLFLSAGSYGQEDLRIYISADMEGVGGVSTHRQVAPAGSEYQKFRRLMTLEVNAAIEGAYRAGATEVLVSDSHGGAQNIDVELLDSRAKLIRAWPRALGMVHGIDESFDAAVFVGYHAREGDVGVLAHTFTENLVMQLNDEIASEATFAGAIAGHFGVPVVFVSGDQVITRDVRRQFGPIEVAVVKEAYGQFAAKMLHPEEARRLISIGVERGINNRSNISPYVLKTPVILELRWEEPVMAEIVSLMRGAERLNGITTTFTGVDMIEVAEFFEVIHHIRPPR